MTGFTEAAVAAMTAYSWPGNVRELDHAVERGVLMARGERIGPADLGIAGDAGVERTTRLEDLPLEDVERLLIRKALARFDGNVTRTADFLGLSRSALYRRLEKYDLT
jgi:DNA-binding NtrC family response regulator